MIDYIYFWLAQAIVEIGLLLLVCVGALFVFAFTRKRAK